MPHRKPIDEAVQSLERIIAANPGVDPRRLEKTLKLLKELRALGLERSQYDLLHPYSRRIRRSTEEAEPDPRLVRLGSRP
jgi:hypothetical protein